MASRTRRLRGAASRVALVGALAGLFAGVIAAAPAAADTVYTAVLHVTKSVQNANLAPTDTLAYTIAVECLTDDCVDAQLVDTIPAEFDALTLNPTVVVTGGASTYSWGGTNNRTLTVNFTKSTPSGPGIPSGDGYSVQVSLAVPANLSPDWPSNGMPVTNTATVTATTAATASGSVPVTITVPYTVATTAAATWSPSTTQFKVDELSNLTLTTRNTSNAKADTLTLLAPTDPTLSTNLFERVNFDSFGTVTFPAGADRIQVDAYVAGSWINGTWDTVAGLPAGVAAGQVTGLRITFGSSTPGAQITANGSAGSVVLNLTQRAATRTSGTSLVTGAVATANVRGTVSVPGHGTQSANASATYTVTGLDSVVSGSVIFSTARIPAGGWTVSTITGRNASNGILSQLTVTQPAGSFLTDKVTFGGFTSAATWPAGATAATVTWFVAGQPGDIDPDPVELTSGDAYPPTPTLSATQRITGFSIQFRGTISLGATTGVPFRVNAAADAVAAVPGTAVFAQTAQIDGVNDAGAAPTVYPTANLTVLYPQVDVALNKTVTPSAAVPAGGRSVVQLRAATSSDSGYVSPTSIAITDAMTASALDYWRAFDAVAIAPTQIPAGATLLIEGTTDGTNWVTISSTTAGASAIIHQEALVGGTNLVGLRFTFSNAGGFGQGTTVQANIAFVARATLRGTANPTASDGANVTYVNNARADAVGEVLLQDGSAVSSTSTGASSAVVKTIPSGPGAGLMFGKAWVPVSGSTTVSSQSGQQRTARLSWGSEIGGYDSAAVSDPADPTAPVASTVFQAFDLVRIQPITSSNDHYIAYDKVSNVELYVAGSWVSIFAEACATASDCIGQFAGYSLSTQESTDATGVRLTFVENSAARSTDPLAPPIGSGVASGPDQRTIDLTFQIRNRLRDAAATSDPTDPWVTGDRVYNDTDPGSVSNSATLAVDSGSASSSASMLILDPVPTVTLTKAAQPKTSTGTNLSSPVSIPVFGDVASTAYPSVQYTMTVTNASAARAWYLRVTDQMPCSASAVSDCAHPTSGGVGGWTVNPYQGKTWDSTTSPFQYLTIRAISYTLSSGSGIDPAASTVVLWYADGTNASMSLTSAVGLSAASLTNVVGVSALFGGTSNLNGGTIANGATATLTLDTRMRQYLRSDASTQLSGSITVTNSSFAQGWDGVLPDTTAYASKSASITLSDASLAVAVSKSASVTTILEANRTVDSNVTITANQSTSTASTRQVVIQDIEPTFWNAFELRSLTSVSKPSGANSMRVDVQLNGSSTWTLGTVAASNPTLPSGITNSQVTGLRTTYYKADGSLFSVTSPAAPWSTSVVFVVRLRSTYRDGTGAIPFPATITNTATATSDHPTLGTKSASANRSFTLDPGTFKVDVQKYTPVKTTPAGETVSFSLISTNTGTGYLDNPVIVDQLPLDSGLAVGGPLLFDPTSEITYSTSSGGILSTTTVSYVYDAALRKLTFTWPTGARLAPGEIYTIVIPLQVAPGLPATYGDVTNRMTFNSDRTLAASGGCTNSSGNGEGVTKVGANGCSTSNDVTTVSASAISSFKGVKGNVDAGGVSTSGAVNVNNAATACVADGQGFYRNPCAAYSVVGGTDLWKLQFTNGGNVPSTSASIVDVLPKAGDVYLGTGASRGSTYRPVFAGGLTLATDTAGGTTYTWEVTTTPNPCPNFTTNGTCSTATWQSGPSFSSAAYGTITGIRVNFTFAGAALPPGATLAVTYQTVNTPTTSPGDGRAPVTAPLGTPRAWNSFGVDALFPTGFVERRVEPVRAGVQLASGPIQVGKVILGATASYAPTSFAATASCTVAGVPVVLPASGALTLAAINAVPYTARIDGIPVGSTCQIVENTTGASSVSYSPAGTGAAALTVAQAAASTAPVPAAQIATITNTYDTTDLTITKAVVTTATAGAFGPFAFTLACTVNTGTSTLTVPLAPGDASFTLADAESHTVTGLPVTARCALREADSDGATTIGVRVDSGSTATVAQNAPATIVLGANPSYTATVTNTYSAGRLAIHKDVAGDGEADYAGGTYVVAVVCSYDGQTLFDDSIDIVAAQTVLLDPVFPIGTACDVTETDAGGATTPASDASVTIALGTTTTILTNRFDTGTLTVTKSRTGDWATYGAGPFEAQVVCTWNKPGNPAMVIALPDSGYLTLDSAHGYTASVTGLIAGADCSVTETKTGAATISTVSALTPRYIPDRGTSTVTITNDYATGSLRIDKVRDIAPGAEEFATGPFTVAVACGIDRDGTWYDLDLGADATQTLSAGDDYTATVDGILQGASCTVTETDAGLAITSDTTPVDGTVVIPAAVDGPVVVTVTNHFLTGQLDVEKTVAESLVQGGDTLHYTIDVANVGDVEAGGVTVTDAIDPDLNVGTITGDDWTCDVTGRDVDGYGGTLTCDLVGTLPVEATAPTIAYTADLRATYSADTIDNTAVVASTTIVVAGDRDTISTPVKWLAADASGVCVQDAPWLNYTVNAHNLDVSGRTMRVSWLNVSGDVVHTDDVPIAADGTVSGRLLWPGAAVDADGNGVAWPGWRPALPGETPDWENLVLDPTLPTFGLRSGASVRFTINPSTTVTMTYPPTTASCAETPEDQTSDLWMSKTASTNRVSPGGTFTYTMKIGNRGLGGVGAVVLVDDVPNVLRILSVTPTDPADASAPAWVDCVVTDKLPSGFGGVITCTLDRALGYNQQTPDVLLEVQLSPNAPAGAIINTAKVTGYELPTFPLPGDPGPGDPGFDLTTLALQDSAMVQTAGRLAFTGSTPFGAQLAVLLITLGGMLVIWRRSRTQKVGRRTSRS